MITNMVNSDRQVLCPVCNRPTVWQEGMRPSKQHKGKEELNWRTSPMIKVKNAFIDALVHKCCVSGLEELLRKERQKAELEALKQLEVKEVTP